ncbi:MAG TPA: shikimate dehydrogenase [Chitinophagaceae bacterium]
MRLFGLIGYPLTHSFSKNFFAEKFKKERIRDCSYENFQLPTIDLLPEILNENSGLEGLNVTIPYKESVLPFLAEANNIVKQVRACNCIRILDKRLIGYNTDVLGFERSLLNNLKPWHDHALILGTGGAAKAVGFVLQKMGIPWQYVSRKPSTKSLDYQQITEQTINSNKLIINTTPVGMFPHKDELPPLNYNAITNEHFLFDLIYNPAETLFLKKGRERKALVQNGYDMLVYQAEESWKIWNE